VKTTILVVGAGVIGLSTAYQLARDPACRVIVLEKDVCGAGSSSRAAGIITGLLWSETGVRARQKSLALFRELSHSLPGYRFRDVGCLNLFDDPALAQRQPLLPLYDRLAIPYEILDAAEMQRRWPSLQVPPGTTGLYDPLGGYSEPDEYLPALVAGVRAREVEIREGVQVTGFAVRDGRLAGVQTAEGEIGADAVVCTVHAWVLKLIEAIGAHLPIKTFVHQRYVTQPLAVPPSIPAINANPLGGYVRPSGAGALLVGVETPDRAEYRVASLDFQMTQVAAPPGLGDEAITRFSTLVPALAGATCRERRVGLIAFSLDGEPVLGPLPGPTGLYVGAAFHSCGFAYNPVAGLILSQLVLSGQSEIDVAAFAPGRFVPAEVDAYLGETVAQSQVFKRRH